MKQTQQVKTWNFDWPLMDVLIGGKSSIDILKLFINSPPEADKFLKSYGYMPGDPSDQRKLDAIFIESIHFIAKKLIPKQWRKGLKPPEKILKISDYRDLLIHASGEVDTPEQKWACAILKVMHTISHIDNLERLSKLKDAQEQIIQRFEQAIYREASGKIWFGSSEERIELVKLELKREKTRNSIILKLLHKPINVSETIYDLLGVRIVTKTQFDAVVAVKFLRQFYLIDFPNTHPGRARNSLVDLSNFRKRFDELLAQFEKREIDEASFYARLADLNCPPAESRAHNPHSAKNYRAIALTCRQRVKYYPPELLRWRKIKAWIDQEGQNPRYKPYQAMISGLINLANEQTLERSVFFPFEVQILDEASAQSSEKGLASHDQYKNEQLKTARRRILGSILAKPRPQSGRENP